MSPVRPFNFQIPPIKKPVTKDRFFYTSPVKTSLTQEQNLSGAGRGNRTLI
jgi:hypothetical protein